MKAKHTHGQWWNSGLEVGAGPLMTVKVARVSGANYEEALANARLIAAAPELLEALEAMMGRYASKNPAFDTDDAANARAAIAKAKGYQA